MYVMSVKQGLSSLEAIGLGDEHDIEIGSKNL
jgi:hypothetical protein